jgi:galactitol 2-dehydrogenase
VKLENKVAIVTGGARGIGRVIAAGYVAEGAKVVVADIAEDTARATAADIGGNAIGLPLDVTKQASIDALLDQTLKTFGPVEVLVNNAAIFSMGPILEITREQYAKVFQVNVEGLLFTLQAAARQMVDHGIKGRIINMASQAGRRGEKKKAVGLAVPYGRMGKPEDFAGAAVFLASDDAEYVVAQTLNVDGGNWMS